MSAAIPTAPKMLTQSVLCIYPLQLAALSTTSFSGKESCETAAMIAMERGAFSEQIV